MTVEQLRKAYEKQPFVPIELYLAGGRVIPVPHRDFMLVPPRAERTFAVADNHGVIETIDLLLVVSIKPMNNRSRRRAA